MCYSAGARTGWGHEGDFEMTYHFISVTREGAETACVSGYRLPVAGYLFPVTCFRLPVAGYLLPVSGYLLPVPSRPVVTHRLHQTHIGSRTYQRRITGDRDRVPLRPKLFRSNKTTGLFHDL